MQIRTIEPRDIPALEHICLATAPPALKKDVGARETTLLQYNRWYTRCAREHCFTVTDNRDTPVGYILCAPDYRAYKQSFRKNECKQIRKYGYFRYLCAYFAPSAQKKYAGKYPAHLHIDILPAYQNQGAGGDLMKALKSHLKDLGISGIFLSVGKQNRGAIRFYKRNGFCVLDIVGGAVQMGCAL